MADPDSDKQRQQGATSRAPAAEDEEAPPAPPATAGVGGGAPGIATPRNPGGLPHGGSRDGDAADAHADETPTSGPAERGEQ